MDNRLDFINEFEDKEAAIETMTDCRKMYIAMDEALREMVNDPQKHSINPALGRTVALARTHLETSLQYAIKSLCLLHEKKKDVAA